MPRTPATRPPADAPEIRETCRHCRNTGGLIQPYLVRNGRGQFIHVWLHQECSPAWIERYRAWKQQRSQGCGGVRE